MPKMFVIAMAAQKGGVGKTTITAHLAVAAHAAGAGPVAVIDFDPQGTLSAWWNCRAAEDVAFFPTHLGRLSDQLNEIAAQGYKLVLIDTPPAASPEMAAVIRAADLVLVPTRPSPNDLRALGSTLDQLHDANAPFVFVVNAARAAGLLTAQSLAVLSEHGTVARVIVGARDGFASSMTDGRTIQEIDPKGKGAAEVSGLWSYIADRLRSPKKGR